MTTANQSKGSIIRNRRGLETRNLPEARETRVTKLCLVLVWNLIGQESGANFQDQSKSEVKQERTIYILLRLCVHDDGPPLHKILQRFPLFFFFFFFTTVSFCFSCSVDPCQLHTVLHDEDRDIEDVGGNECDRQLNAGWYRFLNKTGIRMPTTCPPTDTRCGTSWPGWLEGVHPTVEDGIVARTVYFRRRQNCKELAVHNIDVKNCSSFFVYFLRPTSKCTYRYCYSSK